MAFSFSNKTIQLALAAGAGLLLLGAYLQLMLPKLYLARQAGGSSKLVSALWPSACQASENPGNPRPALFIGCGIFE